MADLQEAVGVTEDVREQASNLGYELKRKVTQISGQYGKLWPASDDSPIPGEPCHIMSRRGPFAGFWFGPYDTKEEAETKGLAEILHWHARAEGLAEGFRVVHGAGNLWRVSRRSEGELSGGPALADFRSVAEALDEAESRAQSACDTLLLIETNRRQRRLEKCKCSLPIVLKDVHLDSFQAKTDSLTNALDVACEYVAKFHLHREGLVLCGPVGVGKTSLACAIAAGLATADHPAEARYVTVLDLISAEVSGMPLDVSEPDLLVLDWFGIDSKSNHKADRDSADLLAAISSRVVVNVLEKRHKDEARYAQNRPTLLIADCDRLRLERYLGPALFAKVREKLWRILELECPSTSGARKEKE